MIINGKELSQNILEKCKKELKDYPKENLIVVTIGDDPASKVYVRNKQKAAEQIGIGFQNIRFSEEDTFETVYEELLKYIYSETNLIEFNPTTAGIIIQLPIVSKVLTEDQKKAITLMVPDYLDVDGFNKNSNFIPCTPKGIVYMLKSIPEYSLIGKTALIIGRSNIVGKPVAKLLLDEDCTVIQAHSKTPKEKLIKYFAEADIVISAVGKPYLIKEEDLWNQNIKYDKIIIDVGMNRDKDGKLCGDLEESIKQNYSKYYSPVPGGVGPMTVAMLMDNITEAITCKH